MDLGDDENEGKGPSLLSSVMKEITGMKSKLKIKGDDDEYYSPFEEIEMLDSAWKPLPELAN